MIPKKIEELQRAFGTEEDDNMRKIFRTICTVTIDCEQGGNVLFNETYVLIPGTIDRLEVELFEDTRIYLEAKAENGYLFKHWLLDDEEVISENEVISFEVGDSLELKACFKKI